MPDPERLIGRLIEGLAALTQQVARVACAVEAMSSTEDCKTCRACRSQVQSADDKECTACGEAMTNA